MVTSAASPSAPRAAAENDVAIEKKMTVPPSAVARIAPCSQPGTSTQTTVTSAGAAEGLLDGGRERDRVAGVGEGDGVGEADLAQQRRLVLDRHHTDGAGSGPPGGGQRHRPALAGAADDGDPGAGRVAADHALGERGRPADVHHGHRQRAGQVVGQAGGDRAAEQDRVPRGRHLLGLPVPAGQAVGDPQRRQRQRHQRRDPVADPQPQRRLRADLVDDADQHAAGAGDRVLHLAAGGHDLEHLAAHGVAVTAVLGRQLAERRGVEVEPLDPDPDLVGADLGAGVQPLGGLRQRAGRREHPVQADGRGVWHDGSLLRPRPGA